MFEPQPPRRVQPPTVVGTRAHRRLRQRIHRGEVHGHRGTAPHTHTHTRAHNSAAPRRRRGAVRHDARHGRSRTFCPSSTRGCAAARTSLSIARQPHGMATAGATQRARRFKRYVTVPAGPPIGRRPRRRPIARAPADSRGKTKCSVTVARRKSAANHRARFLNRSFARLAAPMLESEQVQRSNFRKLETKVFSSFKDLHIISPKCFIFQYFQDYDFFGTL